MGTDEIGNQYIVKMQVAGGKDFIKRAQYYAAKTSSSQNKLVKAYARLTSVEKNILVMLF